MTHPLASLQPGAAPDLTDQVYRALLDAISAGSLAPGQRITQDELAAQLAVSRQPVMQALRLLKKDGFVQDAPQTHGPVGRCRGLQVTPLDTAWIAQVYEVRSALDGLAVRLATERRTLLDPALLTRGRDAVKRGDIKAMIDADLAFHTALYRATQNPLIEQSALLHWHHIRRAMGAALQADFVREPVWDEHEAIARAVASGDVALADALMRQHGQQASHLLSTELNAQTRAVTPPTRARKPRTSQLRGHRLLA